MKSKRHINAIIGFSMMVFCTSPVLGQIGSCQTLPNGEFNLDLKGWTVIPDSFQSGQASAFHDVTVFDGTPLGGPMDAHVLLLQAFASAMGTPEMLQGENTAFASLLVQAPALEVQHRYLVFEIAGGYELVSFGSSDLNFEARVEIAPSTTPTLLHLLGDLAFPPFPTCEWGISILGTFEGKGPVVIDVLSIDGRPTGIQLGDVISLAFVLNCSAAANQTCDEGEMYAALAIDDIRFCAAPPGTAPGDVTGDGIVNVDDLLNIINAWGVCGLPPFSCPSDLSGNGLVDVDDLLMVLNYWG